MPLFEFICTNCEQPFEELVRSAAVVDEVSCPSCGSDEIRKMISTFASHSSGSSAFSFNSNSSAVCNTGST